MTKCFDFSCYDTIRTLYYKSSALQQQTTDDMPITKLSQHYQKADCDQKPTVTSNRCFVRILLSVHQIWVFPSVWVFTLAATMVGVAVLGKRRLIWSKYKYHNCWVIKKL